MACEFSVFFQRNSADLARFRWVECQFRALSYCSSKRQLDKALVSLPQGLDETYKRMLLNIDEVSVQDAKRILTLLCCAKRPLTVAELIDATAVELEDEPRLNPDGRLLGEDAIRAVCPGLVEFDVRRDEDTTVRIAHFSVQEYLESERIPADAAKFGVTRLEANAEIASICLTYLLEPALLTEPIKEYPLHRTQPRLGMTIFAREIKVNILLRNKFFGYFGLLEASFRNGSGLGMSTHPSHIFPEIFRHLFTMPRFLGLVRF